MAKVKNLYDETKDLMYNYSKVKLTNWLAKTENLILFENFICLLKDHMLETFGNVE